MGDSTTNNKYQEILNKYAQGTQKVTPPTQPEPPKPDIASLPAPELLKELPQPDLPLETSSGMVVTIFKVTALLSFLFFVGILGKVALNTLQNQSANDLTKVRIIPPSPTAIPTITENYACNLNDMHYKVGESFMAADGCNKCVCAEDGSINCESNVCTSPAPLQKPTAAPVTCSFAGKTYRVGETYKNDCNTCLCTDGGVAACTKMACIKN